jgi:hypothetical protein
MSKEFQLRQLSTINFFREQKTGKTPWTQAKVDKHFQLDIYSTLLEEADGFVQDECELMWVKTENLFKTMEFDGIQLQGTSTDIVLTGEYKIFKRIITAKDRKKCRERIVRVGREIEEDFAAYKHLYVSQAPSQEQEACA